MHDIEMVPPKLPALPKKWDYQASVKRNKAFLQKAPGFRQELWIAREMLSRVGNPSFQAKNATGANAPVKTWSDYCNDIGLLRSRRIADLGSVRPI